jgi:hypothetical protein
MDAGKWDFVKKRLRINRAELSGVQAALSKPGCTHGDRVIAALVAGGMCEDVAFCAAVTSGLTGEPITFVLRD